MADLWLEPYEEAIGEFPLTASSAKKLEAALARAVRAPSVHNTQPWWYRILGDSIEIGADRSRLLAAADPQGRELMISCGALVEYLSIVLGRFGQAHDVEILQEPGVRDAVARVTLGGIVRPDLESAVLYNAIPARRTNRHPFERRSLPKSVLDRAARQARVGGAQLSFVEGRRERSALVNFVVEADRVQMADAGFRRELGRWLRVPATRSRDGIPAPNGKAPLTLRPVAPLLVRTFDIGSGIAAYDRRIAARSPLLAVLVTQSDDPIAWLGAGRALARVLLSLASDGVAASFLNQPIEVPEIRASLRSLHPRGTHSQIVLRAGYARQVPETPRRALSDICR